MWWVDFSDPFLFNLIKFYFQTCGLLITHPALKWKHLLARNYEAFFLFLLRNSLFSHSHLNKEISQQNRSTPDYHFKMFAYENQIANDSSFRVL